MSPWFPNHFCLDDFLLDQTYFNSDVLNLVRALVTGGVSAELEAQFAEGREVPGLHETPEIAVFRRRAKLTQIPLYEGPMKQFGVSYQNIDQDAAKNCFLLCDGILILKSLSRTFFPVSFSLVLSMWEKILAGTGHMPLKIWVPKSKRKYEWQIVSISRKGPFPCANTIRQHTWLVSVSIFPADLLTFI